MASAGAELRLIQLSAGTAGRRSAKHAELDRLVVDVDWGLLSERLRLRKLLPTLGPRIVGIANGRADDDFEMTVEEAVTAGRRQGSFLQLVSMRVTTMLAEAGIRSLALKGPLLGEDLYGDPGRRLSSDVDLLVAPEQLQAAVEVTRQLGYGAPADYVLDCGLPLLHFVVEHEQDELPPIELHWRVHWYEQSFACERLLPPAVDPGGIWRPARVDELTALLLFYARDGFVDLRLATDLGAWWDVHGSELERGELEEVVRSYPRLARALKAAMAVAERTVGLPAEQVFAEVPRLGRRERIAVRLANPHPQSSPSQTYADIGLIDGLLAPRGDFEGFVRRQILPPPQVLDQQARHAARSKARSRLARSVGVLARYCLSVTRLTRASAGLR